MERRTFHLLKRTLMKSAICIVAAASALLLLPGCQTEYIGWAEPDVDTEPRILDRVRYDLESETSRPRTGFFTRGLEIETGNGEPAQDPPLPPRQSDPPAPAEPPAQDPPLPPR